MRKCGAKGAGGHARRGLHLTTTPSKQQRASLVMFGRWWSSQMRPMLKAASDAKGCTRAWLVARVWPPDLGTTRRYVRSEPILEGAASSVAVEWPLWRHPRGAPQQMWPASLCRNGERKTRLSYPPRPSLPDHQSLNQWHQPQPVSSHESASTHRTTHTAVYNITSSKRDKECPT